MTDQLQAYYKNLVRKRIIIMGLACGIVVMFFLSINAGASAISVKDVCLALIGKLDGKADAVVRNIRLPRVVTGIVAGAGLSLAGCIMQNNLRNPLASPSTLGISNAAAFGANVAIIVLGAGSILSADTGRIIINNPYIVTICALVFSLGAMGIILALSKLRDFSPESIVLAGVAISSLFSAGTMIIQYFAGDSAKVATVIFWTFGDLSRASWGEIGILTLVVVLAYVYFIFRRWDYNALDSGEDTAKSLGINVEKIRLGGLFVSSVISAICVSFLGIIGFVGLIAPQISIRIVGNDKRYLIPTSACMGTLILLISDTLSRVIISPLTLPVGAVTSFFGAPLFLYLLMKGHKGK